MRIEGSVFPDDPVSEQLVKKFLARYGPDPILEQVPRDSFTIPPMSQWSAIQVLGYQRYLFRFAQMLHEAGNVFMTVTDQSRMVNDEKRASNIITNQIHNLVLATPVVWTRDATTTAAHLKPPTFTVGRDTLSRPMMLWLYEQPVAVMSGKKTLVKEDTYWIIAATVVCENSSIVFRGVAYAQFADFDHPSLFVTELAHIPFGVYTPDPDDDVTGPFMSMLAFMNSPYIPTEHKTVSRQLRKQVEKAKLRMPGSGGVTFINLRKLMVEDGGEVAEDGVERRGRRYTHRWVVRGHMRAQWYPSSQSHRPIYIPPHMRGPSDAPVLTHVVKVAR